MTKNYSNTPSGIVDLSKAKKGDKLISCHGDIFTFEGKDDRFEPFPYEVSYPNGAGGSRTIDGFVFRHKRLASDHDIVFIRTVEDQEALKEFELSEKNA